VIRYRKADRKTVGVRIGPEGIEVRLPLWVGPRDQRVQAVVQSQLARYISALPEEFATAQPISRAQLSEEVRLWAQRLGVQPRRVQVRQMRNRWGSCSSLGNVTFSDRLLEMPQVLREYIICHELAHLRYLNHGAEFRRLVSSFIPDWPQRRSALAGWVVWRELAAGKRSAGKKLGILGSAWKALWGKASGEAHEWQKVKGSKQKQQKQRKQGDG
jgi:predicted metal-dependent hydrolase